MPDIRSHQGRGSFDYDIAISYSREDRTHAEALVGRLQKSGVRVFYDLHEQANLWGVDLSSRLDEVYVERSRFIVILASQHYGQRRWTMHERNAIRRRLLEDEGSVLPIAIGLGSIHGLPEALGRIDLEDGIEPIVTLLLEKLNGDESMPHSQPQKHSSMSPALQPSVQGHGNRVVNSSKIKHSPGIGGLGLTSILLVVLLTIGSLLWLFLDFIKNMPRNKEGGVELLGIPLPAALVGEGEPESGAVVEDKGDEDEGGPEEAAPHSKNRAPTRTELAGVWRCPTKKDGFITNSAIFMFTDSGQVSVRHWAKSYNPFNAPFSHWNDAEYTFPYPGTIKVDDSEVLLNLSTDGQQLRIMGGAYHFECIREKFASKNGND